MFEKFREFNEMYDLPRPDKPTLPENLPLQITNFTKILRDELDEGFDVIEKFHKGADQLELLTDVADWLHDICVYCFSEAVKYGLPSEDVLKIIMESNSSKRGENGEVLKDCFGKVLKGPNYWKPEPKVAELLKARM